MEPTSLRRRTALALLTGLVVTAACSMDEAALIRPGAEQVHAEPGQLRVLSALDDPTEGDQWIDVVTPDPEVYDEGDEFREDDSRTADPEEPAERRRLFTATERGRTLLVELNCSGCDGGVPSTPAEDTGLRVWDLVVGDPGQWFSPGTDLATAGTTRSADQGEYLVVVRPGDEGPATVDLAGPEALPVRLVATHSPDDGADLFVDVYAMVGPGDATITYRTREGTSSYAVSVR